MHRQSVGHQVVYETTIHDPLLLTLCHVVFSLIPLAVTGCVFKLLPPAPYIYSALSHFTLCNPADSEESVYPSVSY